MAPAPDPDRSVSAFARSREEDHALGIFTQEEVAAAQEEEEEEEEEEVRRGFKLGVGSTLCGLELESSRFLAARIG